MSGRFAVVCAVVGMALTGAAETPLIRFGVASDVHILKDWSDRFTPGLVNQERYLEKALRWFDAEGADAVLFPGDMCHGGRVSELQAFAAVWDRVFPGGKGADGRRVERLAVTGNHEIGQWGGLWDGISDEELRRVRLDYDLAHLKANWKRVMGEEFAPVWKREVKGISFIGVHYSALNPDIGGFFRAHAAELDPDKPFFVFQHRSPAFTCQGRGYGPEETLLTKLLSPHPNAVAITGHTHYSLADDRNVWQGAFTAIDAGCACAAEPSYADMTFENGGASYTWEYRKQRMRCLSQCGNEGRGCILVTVYADRLEIRRRSLEFDEPLGPDWRVPLPAAPGGPFDYGVCARKIPAPQFAAGAKVAIEICKTDPGNVGPGLKGKPCLRVTFPYAGAVEGSRTFAYDVQAFAGGREVFASRVLSYGYHLPERRSHVPGECILALADLPKGEDIVFAIRPLGVYRQPGKAILSAPVTF